MSFSVSWLLMYDLLEAACLAEGNEGALRHMVSDGTL